MPDFDRNQLRILIHVALARLLGAFIGRDRAAANQPAGLRTYRLGSGAAAFRGTLGGILMGEFRRELGDDFVRVNPLRISQAVTTGLSFLGARTIVRDRAEGGVQGQTTAACLPFAAAVGVGVVRSQALSQALSQWILAVGGMATGAGHPAIPALAGPPGAEVLPPV